jgi:acetoin utilization protein AcuB
VKRIPSIATAMTPFPYSIAAEAKVEEAVEMMRTHGIHHLPVMRGETLIGLLWHRDVRVAQRLLPGDDGLTVDKLCSPAPYIVELSERLDLVVLEMANRRSGAAMVTRQGRLAGILTTTDVCRLLGETLRDGVIPPDDDGDVA